jgi:hypothetical protein
MYFKHVSQGVGIDTGPTHVRFLVGKIALTHDLFQELGVFPHSESYYFTFVFQLSTNDAIQSYHVRALLNTMIRTSALKQL